jgi:hypothetical protein
VVVRFLPAWGQESQIAFLEKGNGSILAMKYRLRTNGRSISELYDRVLRNNPSAKLEDVLKQIAVEKVEVTAGPSERNLLAEFFSLSIPTAVSPDFCADGTTYEVWVETSSNRIYLSLSDCAYGKESDSAPILRWVRTVEADLGGV